MTASGLRQAVRSGGFFRLAEHIGHGGVGPWIANVTADLLPF
jgi:hypothetical protein